jgi:hypothetical protein
MRLLIVPALALTVAGCGAVDDPGSLSEAVRAENGPPDAHVKMAGNGHKTPGPLIDHGGKLLSTSHTYAIWWGDQSAFPPDSSDLVSLLGALGGSNYLAIANEYMRGATATSTYLGSFTDTSAPPSHGPTTAAIVAEACSVINANGLTADTDALYAVFTSNFPKVNYCAWHSHGTCNGVDIQVAYLPSGTGVAGCDPFIAANLNCNSVSQYTRSVADSLVHEFMETVTDPDINAWLDQNGGEIGDKCNFTYASCVSLGGVSWQIQEEWSNAANGCVQGN